MSEENRVLVNGVTDPKAKLVLAMLLERIVTLEMEIAAIKREQARMISRGPLVGAASSGGPSIG